VRHDPAVVATGYDIAGRMTLKWQPGPTGDPEK